jgi:parallel beta-helix repeat protein
VGPFKSNRRALLCSVALTMVAIGTVVVAPGNGAAAKPSCQRTKTCPSQTTTTTTAQTTTTTTAQTTTTTTAQTTTTATTSPPSTTTTTTAPSPSGGSCTGVTLTPASDLQAAFDAASEGTTFCLAPGVYRLTQAARPKSGSVIWGMPGAVLNGSRLESAFARSGSSWVLTGQTQEFTPSSTGPCASEGYTGCHRPEGVFYDDQPLWQVTSPGELGPGRFFFDSGADAIYLADDPTGHKVEVTVAPAAIIGFGGETGQRGVTVRGLVVEKFASTRERFQVAPIKAGWDWVIEDNEIRLNASAGVAVSDGTVLRRNSLHHNGQYGFEGGPLIGLTVEANDIGFNNTAGFDQKDDAGGSKVIRSSNLVFRHNTVHDNNGPGLWTDWENINVTYEANTLERNTGPGIFHEASADATIRNNTFGGIGTLARGKSLWWGADLYLNDSKNTEIYGNDIEAGVHGIGLADVDRGSTAYGRLEIRNVYVHDNVVKMRGGGFTGMVGNREAAYTSANNRFEHNTYYVTDLVGTCWQWGGAHTQSGWQAKGQDVTGTVLSLAR